MLVEDSVLRLQEILDDEGLTLTLTETRSIGELLVSMGTQLNMSIKNKDEYEEYNQSNKS